MLLLKEFYDFIVERESIRVRRKLGLPREEWTSDPILKAFSFTNVKRHHDRTTTLLKKEFYDPIPKVFKTEPQVFLLNAAIYRYFGTIESARVIGWCPDWTPEFRHKIWDLGASHMLKFTPAYIIPAAGRSDPKFIVVLDIIDSIWSRADEIVCKTKWEEAIDVLRECYGVGAFMAKEVYLDFLLVTGHTPEDWSTWTPTGPGGKRGASVIRYGDAFKISETEALQIIREVYEARGEYWPAEILGSPSVELDLTDIQFQCCEFDKYQRVVRGDGKPKRYFNPTTDAITKD